MKHWFSVPFINILCYEKKCHEDKEAQRPVIEQTIRKELNSWDLGPPQNRARKYAPAFIECRTQSITPIINNFSDSHFCRGRRNTIQLLLGICLINNRVAFPDPSEVTGASS